ncbi:hypothetical protein CU098_004751 [Rhizopus stolonifer]|uniref:Uncharacterized protein n=1 Tax=Rhizopus stolonifer TaxID=4846 RepID=A0A367KTF2_RHIST|nr:hypothetical protein CU098_004751 [Rhizopus stolonifer]
MLTAVQQNLPPTTGLVPESNNNIGILTRKKAIENFRSLHEEANIDHDYASHLLPNSFEIANRAFYATIRKFTKQNCPDPSVKRRSSYSFIENLFLHKIYSKSQQTLLGIVPVKPSVILSGDDFMFTPPFIQPPPQPFEDLEDEDYYFDEEEVEATECWNTNGYLYNLSPCPESKQAGDNDSLFYRIQEEDEDLENNKLRIQSNAFLKTPSLFDTSPYLYQEDTQEYMYAFVENSHLQQEPAYPENFDTQQDDDTLSDSDGLITPEGEEPELSSTATTAASSYDDDNDDDNDNDDDDNDSYHEEMSVSYHSTTNSVMIPITTNKTNEDDVAQITQVSPVTRSSTFLSQRSSLDDDSSVISYQSLADIINSQQQHQQQKPSLSYISSKIYHYGSTKKQEISTKMKSFVNNISYHANNDDDEEMGLQSQQECDATISFWTRLIIFVMSIWQLFVHGVKQCMPTTSTLDERETLL